MKFKRKRRENNSKKNLSIIGAGLLIISITGFYLYSTKIKSQTEGLKKTIFLSVQNNSKTDTLIDLLIVINGQEILSKKIHGKIVETIDTKLIAGNNTINLFANKKLIRQDSLFFSSAQMFDLNIFYSDSVGVGKFNFWMEEFYYE